MKARYVNFVMALFFMMFGVAVLSARDTIAKLSTLNILTEGIDSWFRYVPGWKRENIEADLNKIAEVVEQIVPILHWLGNGSIMLGIAWLIIFFVVLKFTT